MIGLPSNLTRADLLNIAWAEGMTVRNVVRCMAIGQGLSDDVVLNDHMIDFILWERTAYPVCGLEHTLRQVHAELSVIAASPADDVS